MSILRYHEHDDIMSLRLVLPMMDKDLGTASSTGNPRPTSTQYRIFQSPIEKMFAIKSITFASIKGFHPLDADPLFICIVGCYIKYFDQKQPH